MLLRYNASDNSGVKVELRRNKKGKLSTGTGIS